MKRELENKATKAKINKSDQWLAAGIVVKVMSKGLKEHGYYKMKVGGAEGGGGRKGWEPRDVHEIASSGPNASRVMG